VKELYDYQKDYFLGSKSQVTLYKGHLGVGVTEPSGQLELAGDERIQEYPPRGFGVFADDPDYSTYIEGHGVFTAYGSSQNNTGKSYSVIGAFDKTLSPDSSCWLSKAGTYSAGNPVSATAAIINGIQGEFIALKSPYPIKLKSFTTQVRGGVINENSRMAKSGIIWGSNDGSTWYHVHSWSGRVYSDANPNYFEVNSTKYYIHHALQTTETQANVDATVIGELKFFGTPGPTTLDKGSLSLTRSLDVPRVSRYDVDTETPRYEKLVLDFDTTVNSSPTDISGKGNHGVLSGGATYESSEKAFKFDGNVERIIANPTLGTGDQTFSVSFWMKRTGSSYNNIVQGPLYIGSFGTAGYGVGMDLYDNGAMYWFVHDGKYLLWNNSSVSGGSYTTFPLNQWVHVAITHTSGTFTASNNKIYIDGVHKSDPTVGGSVELNFQTSNPELRIGDARDNPFTGQISNFKLYDVALEPSEVKKLYNLGRTGRSMVISDTAVGIGKVPEAQLDVRGNLNVDGVITTPQRPVFYAYKPGGAAEADGYTGIIEFTHTRINVGGCFNTSDYKFYAPITGYYWFEFQVLARYGTGNGNIETSLYKNGVNIASRALAYAGILGDPDHDNICFSIPVQMNAGDNIYPGIHDCASGVNAYYGEDLAHFSGYFIG